MCYVEAKGSTSDPDSNIKYGSNSKATITKSNKTSRLNLHPNTYTKLQKSVILDTWSIVRKFKLQIRPSSLILLITTSQDRGIFPSQSWEAKNSIIIIIMSWTQMGTFNWGDVMFVDKRLKEFNIWFTIFNCNWQKISKRQNDLFSFV